MIGFAPTQGHIPSAIVYLGHATNALRSGEIKNVLLVAKGSLFLGRMTQLSDGCSFLIEMNKG
jgi:betaine reductase